MISETAGHDKYHYLNDSITLQNLVYVFYRSIINKTPFYSKNVFVKNKFVTFAPNKNAFIVVGDTMSTLYSLNFVSITKFMTSGDSAIFSPNGKNILIFSKHSGNFSLWDMLGKKIYAYNFIENTNRKCHTPVQSVEIANDNNTVLLVKNGEIAIANSDTNSFLRIGSKDKWTLATCGTFYKDQFHLIAVFEKENENILNRFKINTVSKVVIIGKHEERQIIELNEHIGNVTISRDSKFLLVSCYNKSILIDLNGNQIAKYNGKTIKFTPDNNNILVYNDNYLEVYDLSGKIIKKYEEQSGVIVDVQIFPDMSKILTTYNNNSIKISEMNGNLIGNLLSNENFLRNVSISFDGTKVLAAYYNKIVIWDLLLNMPDHEFMEKSKIFSMKFSSDGTKILTASEKADSAYSCLVSLWNWNGKIHKYFSNSYKRISKIDITPDGNKILVSLYDGTIKLLDTKGKEIYSFHGKSNASFTPLDSNIIGFNYNGWGRGSSGGSGNGEINCIQGAIWDFNGKLKNAFYGNECQLDDAFISPNGQNVLIRPACSPFELFQKSGKFITYIDTSLRRFCQDGCVNTFSPKGDEILFIGSDMQRNKSGASIWALDGTLLFYLPECNDANYSLDGNSLIATFKDTVKILDATHSKMGKVLYTYFVPSVISSNFLQNGNNILVFCENGSMKLLNLSGYSEASYFGNDEYSSLIYFNKNNDQFITMSDMGKPKIWLTPLAIYKWIEKSTIEDLSLEEKVIYGLN